MNLVVNGFNIIEILLVTFLISLFIVIISKRIAEHIGAMDIPNERKVHSKPMPRLGGIGIFASFLFGYVLYGKLTSQMISILISGFILFFLGFIDDIKPLRAKDKFLVQIVVALIVVFYGKLHIGALTMFGYTLDFPILLKQIISVFFILGTINAINLIDGLDGLCGGISLIYFITIAIIAFLTNQTTGLDIVLCIIMIGAILGFLVQNFPPAKTFMGDCGSTFLGFMIATISLLGFKTATLTSLVIPLVILAIPIFDTLLAILRRLIKHKSIGEADKEHLHHQLLKMKFSTKKTVLIIYAINILFSTVTIFYSIGHSRTSMIIYIIPMLILIYIVWQTDILFEHKKKDQKGE